MIFIDILFYLFSICLVISTFMVVVVKHPMFSIVFLAASFIFSSFLLFLLECEFLALLFLVIYLGAIIVLFLFAVMMLESKLTDLLKNKIKYIPIGLVFSICLFVSFLIDIDLNFISFFDSNYFYLNNYQNWYSIINYVSDVQVYGQILYSYYILQFLISGLILLLMLVGVVYLTNTFFYIEQIKNQSVFKQLSRNFKFFSIMLQAPLEQFEILQLIQIKLISFDFSITNFFLINLLALTSFLSIIYFNGVQRKYILSENNYLQENSFFFISSNSWQKIIESVFEIVAQLISDIIYKNNEQYFPIVSILFNFILFSNLIGLIPYSFTVTSHLIVTFTLSFAVFIGINIITFQKYKLKIFSLFLPSNTTFFLALLLVPIEFISYIAKPISLGIRLFINLMAGHSLLKVIVGFSWSMLLLENFTSVGLILPMFILTILFGLELGVALIQTYVFIILTCIYIQDGS